MKKLFVVLVLLAFGATLALAGDTVPANKAGSKALLFTISGLGTFGVGGVPIGEILTSGNPNASPVMAYGAGFKYYFSKDLAGRIGLNVFSQSGDYKQTPQGQPTVTYETSMFGFGITPALEFHTGNIGPVSPYFGAYLSYLSSSETVKQPSGAGTVETKYTGSTFGLGVLLGAEFFAWDQVSFGAEYGLGFASATGKTEPPSGGTTEEVTGTRIGISTYAVWLAIYF